ncbi:helix-turn-helix domain-containing protein [Pseudoalteromonas 'SMAR']|uniref:helix-turn-helix domain-containing protein n=1 Tax=Pseudoalteromonas 'SMAR' TaxID=3416908 RepID=UPI003AF20E88
MQVQPSLANLEQLLTPYMNFTSPPAAMTQSQRFIQRITAMELLPLAYQHTPLSQRQLERQVKKQCGLTPKCLARIYRIRKVKTILKQHPHASLADVALACHFSDQAHLQRELKALLGITPKRYTGLITSQAKVLQCTISVCHQDDKC